MRHHGGLNDLQPRKYLQNLCNYRGGAKSMTLGNLGTTRHWSWTQEHVESIWKMLRQAAPKDLIVTKGFINPLEQLINRTFRVVGLDWHIDTQIDKSFLDPLIFIVVVQIAPNQVKNMSGNKNIQQAILFAKYRI